MDVQSFGHSFYRSADLRGTASSAHQAYSGDEDQSGLLDENVMDHSTGSTGLELSPPMIHSQRESFTGNHGPDSLLAKREDLLSIDVRSLPSNPLRRVHSGNDGAGHIDYTPEYHLSPQSGHWNMDSTGSQTASQHLSPTQGTFSPSMSVFPSSMQNQNSFSIGNMLGSLGGGDHSMPPSPQTEWMKSAGDVISNVRHGDAIFRAHGDFRRGDGIRKKNARSEIPAGRNLNNIDSLIETSKCEKEIKELKHHKRLLRNRQAALDSRQRKKQHTERLEDENKQQAISINTYQDDLASLEKKLSSSTKEKMHLFSIIETLKKEKNAMASAHNAELKKLRDEMAMLVERMPYGRRSGDSSMTPAVHGFDEDFSVYNGGIETTNGMNMPGPWDNSTFASAYPGEQHKCRPQAAHVSARQSDSPHGTEVEKPTSQGGLLFLLFLVGAFVMSGRTAPAIPAVSENIRTVSASILNNALRGMEIDTHPTSGPSGTLLPHETSWMHSAGTMIPGMSKIGTDGGASSILQHLDSHLVHPKQEEINEHILSLSAARFDHVSHDKVLHTDPEKCTSQRRKDYAQALAAVRATMEEDGASDVYKRTSLVSQIPQDVFREFTRMMAGYGDTENEQQCNDG